MELPAGQLWVGTIGSSVCISVRGRATHLHGSPLRDFANEMMRRGYDRFELDLGRCTYMDSTFLGVLASLSSRLAESGFSRWIVYRITPRNFELFTTLGIDRFFEMNSPAAVAHRPSDSTALPAIQSGQPADPAWAGTVLSAHEFLIEADERNEPRFKELLTFLKEDLSRSQPPHAGVPEASASRWKQ